MDKVKQATEKSKPPQEFKDYFSLFVQPVPRYTVKTKAARSWTSKNKPLTGLPVISHLKGKYAIGSLGQWYPNYSILDIDSRPFEQVKEIRAKLNLDENNSMLFESESPDSYHIILRPYHKQAPPTLNLLKDMFKDFGRDEGIEIYPQARRAIRLPFGKHQEALDYEYARLKTWQDKLYWFEKLNQFDLKTIPQSQGILDLALKKEGVPSILTEAKGLLKQGLQAPGTREHSQFIILLFLFRRNVPQGQAVSIVRHWIKNKNNGFSKDFNSNPSYVYNHIKIQAGIIYGRYDLSRTYPDEVHNREHGYITKADLIDIIKICKGSKPKAKFLFNLIKYAYPRRNRAFLQLHTDNLISWASKRTYLTRIKELQELGIVRRFDSYRAGLFSKGIKLNWEFKAGSSILYDGRSLDSLDDNFWLMFQAPELRQLLEAQGLSRELIYTWIKNAFLIKGDSKISDK